MKSRWILAGIFGLAGLSAAGMTFLTWSVPDTGRWMFAAFAALFVVLAWTAARPPKPAEPPTTRFVPAWFFDGAILVTAILILVVIASCIFGRK
ncbi:MAG: hypothetical protein PHE83_14010 [Opitutaceae bacterium]|nr:hypothetical protein [Opitutaceae bacterium]